MAWLTRNIRDSETGRISGKEIWLRFRSAFAVALSVGVLVGGVSFASTQVQQLWQEMRTTDDYEGEGVDPVKVTIPKGTGLSKIADILARYDVIKTAKAFDRAAADNPKAKNIQPGTWNLKTQLPAETAVTMLLDTKNMDRTWLKLSPGARLSFQVTELARDTKLPEADFEKALKNWKKLGLPKWAKKSAEGFLFPDNYPLDPNPEPADVIKQATSGFNQVIKDIGFEDAAAQLNVKPYDALIIASIIEREAGTADREKVARVFYNRLAEGMKFQMDSTVWYALGKTGVGRPTTKETKFDSPYNTYKYKGLPPGPISAPGKASLEAAVNPAEGDWLYFVTVDLDTGETEFNVDLKGHNKSKAKLDKWCAASDANNKKCYG